MSKKNHEEDNSLVLSCRFQVCPSRSRRALLSRHDSKKLKNRIYRQVPRKSSAGCREPKKRICSLLDSLAFVDTKHSFFFIGPSPLNLCRATEWLAYEELFLWAVIIRCNLTKSTTKATSLLS